MSPPPAWPSLYNPIVEFRHFEHRDPIQPRGHYLYNAGDIFRFTFFWMLVFHAPMFIVSGAVAFFNIIYPPHRVRHPEGGAVDLGPVKTPLAPQIPMTPLRSPEPQPQPLAPTSLSPPQSPSPYAALLPRYNSKAQTTTPASKRGKNVGRSRATFAVLTLLTFLVAIVATSLIQSLVVGYILAGVYSAAKYNMSTWVPFVWALAVTASGALGIFPSVMDRI